MKSSLVLNLVFILFTLISCSPAKQDTGQTQVPVLPPAYSEPGSTAPVHPVEAKTAQQPSTQQNNAEVMLNPPHGEPFHRCDIAVGAPLNSQSANTTRQTTNNQVQVTAPKASGTAPGTINPTAPTIENARRMNPSQTQNTVPANNGSKPGLNPPHGQPYHRCDIAVGSPLP